MILGEFETEAGPALLNDVGIDSAPEVIDAGDFDRIIERRFSSSVFSFLRQVKCFVEDDVAVIFGRVPSYYAKQMAQEVVMELKFPLRIDNRCKVTALGTNRIF